ncbi:MAG: hypothetical protein GY869_32520, partial [Planctomycetes bacterium]|nr:hypothetical protein [Planctomycetota bacterium]
MSNTSTGNQGIIDNGNAGDRLTTHFANNIIANNSSFTRPLFSNNAYQAEVIIENNTFVENLSGNGNTNYHHIHWTQTASNYITGFNHNTIIFNADDNLANSTFYLDAGYPSLTNNNFLNPQNQTELYDAVAANPTHLDATQNWWGVTTTQEVEDRIYHFVDDFALQVVDYEPFLTVPDTAAPIIPPLDVLRVINGSDIDLSWDPTPCTDVAGYMVHYGNPTGYSYDTTIDVGMNLSHILSGVPLVEEVAVTAYDGDYNPVDSYLDNQFMGHLSWYSISESTVSLLSINPDTGCRGDVFSLDITGQNTHFSDTTTTVFLVQGAIIIPAYIDTIYNNVFLTATFAVSSNVPTGLYDVYVENDTDGQVVIPGGFTMTATCQSPPTWTIVAGDFSYDLSFVGKFFIDNVAEADPGNMLAAFVGTECRGAVDIFLYFPDADHYVALMPIYSNAANGETITFKAYDASDNRIYDIVETLDFVADAEVGDAQNPFALNADNCVLVNIPF